MDKYLHIKSCDVITDPRPNFDTNKLTTSLSWGMDKGLLYPPQKLQVFCSLVSVNLSKVTKRVSLSVKVALRGWGEHYSGTHPAHKNKHEYTKNFTNKYNWSYIFLDSSSYIQYSP